MPFDASTAKPVAAETAQGGFDLSTAKPVGTSATNPFSEDDKHSSEEYEAPSDKKLSAEAARLERLVRKAEKDGGFLKGAGEVGLSAITGLASTAAGGVAGLGRAAYSLASGEGLDKAAEKGSETIKSAQKAGTYQPRSAAGQAINEAMGAVMSAPGKVGGMVGGDVGEIVAGKEGRLMGESIGEAAPAIIPAAGGLRSAVKSAVERPALPKVDSRGAKLLQKAMDDLSPAELEQARVLVKKSNEEGVPLTGPESFAIAPKLHELLTKVDKSNNIVSRFTKERPEQAKAAIEAKLENVGKNVGMQDAANQAQEAADTVISKAQKFRTEISSPDYKSQRASDAEALKLMDDIQSTQKDVDAGTKWKNDAVQQAGRWYQFSHEMGAKASEVAGELKKWAMRDDELQNQVVSREARQNFENEGGPEPKPVVVIPARVGGDGSPLMQRVKAVKGESVDQRGLAVKDSDIDTYEQRAAEGKSATVDAVNEARRRQDFIDGWKKEIDTKSDKLAEKNLPFIQDKLQGFVSNLDQEIRLAHPDTDAGKVLLQFKNDIAPNGKPLMLPSQLESMYKSSRDKLELGLNPTPLERTTAGVLRGHVAALDSLIQEVSPSIKQGRELYKELSKEFVDPLMKGPVGRIAGKGADAQKEAIIGRVKAELEGQGATPDRLRTVFSELSKADPTAIPNVVRSWLEQKWNKSQKETIGSTNRLSGAKFRESIASTPEERAMIATMIEETAKAQGKDLRSARLAAKGFSDLLDVLQGTGRIPKIGVQGVEESALLDKVVPAATHMKAFGAARTAVDIIRDYVNKGSYENLAKVFTDPDSIDKMVKLANVKSSNKAARQQIVADMLGASETAAVGAAAQPREQK